LAQTNTTTRLTPGAQLGPYRVEALLGAGGMGQVYKARDTRLGRTIALKVLPPEMMADPERKRRFVQEAQTASALNHPNIVTIYDIGSENDVDFIAMEYVDGKTLQNLIPQLGLPLRDVLELAAQAAEALARAHAANIVHRDLKPGNIMVTEEKQVKVVDFGLAKLTEPTREIDLTLTTTGAIVGTPAYMAPEQALGQAVDERSDVFSLGAVLYEMVTGKRAFSGASQVDVLHAITHSTPDPIGPPELQWVVDKALAKDPRERYQSMREFAIDLRRLGKRTDAAPEARPVALAAPKVRRWPLLAAGIAAGLAIASVLWLAGFRRSSSDTEPFLRPEASILRLTSYGGTERAPAISPDGRYFAFVSDRGGTPDIWVRRVSGGEPVRITHDEAPEGGLVYAPTGENIYFTSRGALWSIGALGGSLRKVIEPGRDPAPSPDGTRLAFVRDDGIYVGTADGTGSRRLVAAATVAHLSWSPDGAWLAHAEGLLFDAHQIFVTDMRDGKKRQVTSFTYGHIGGLAWLPDSEKIVFSRAIDRSQVQGHDLWILSVADGRIRRVTLNPSGYLFTLRASRDGVRLITATPQAEREVWKVPLAYDPETNAVRAVRLLDSSWDPMWIHMSQKTLLFNSNATGTRNLWMMPLNGAEAPRQITSFDGDYITHAALSPDGTRVAYVSFESGSAQIWVRNMDGSNPVQLTRAVRPAFWPAWSPDGRRILFGSYAMGVPELWMISASGGDPTRLVQGAGMRCDWSLVTNRLVCSDGGRSLAILDAETGKVIRSIPWPDSGAALPCWSPDGRRFSTYRANIGQGQSIWVFEADSGNAREAVRFKEPFPMLFRASWTSDGQSLIVNRNAMPSHITLFENF
jgi:Tol biopolymer transport system component/predicted Ser/Thr protein kinase